MKKRTIALTEKFQVHSGSHILYFYEESEKYIDNVVSFIAKGIQHEQHVIVIDNPLHTEAVRTRIGMILSESEIRNIHFVDNRSFYYVNDRFEYSCAMDNYIKTVQPYLSGEVSFRSWGHFEIQEQENIMEQLHVHETASDLAVSEMGIVVVCAYAARDFSASAMQQMMKTHPYMMTDTEFVRSSLYKQEGASVIFPSLAEHDKMMGEVDLYKQKLDFVHVVSHEVRNPLTVINAYASLLIRDKTIPGGAKEKLMQISDYVNVIDHEITRIINTEQMLTSDALWKMSPVQALPVIREVITMLSVKARTQGIELFTKIGLSGAELVNCNTIGLRLVLSNLLSNAIKYSDEGSAVRFEAGIEDGCLQVIIEDHGVGIGEEQQRLLFNKYSKMNDEKAGQGIGLYMVKKLMDHFGGEIRLVSEPNKGTQITLQLPLILPTNGR